MCNRFIIFFLLFFSKTIFGQNFDQIDIPILKNSNVLQLSAAGGMRSPQFSNIDFNNDKISDLFVFDRNGDQILPFVHVGAPGTTDYRYAPEYISQFPSLKSWALLVDYNHDGLEDIFASGDVANCIEVWRAKKSSDNRITYKKLRFNHSTFPNVLSFLYGGFYTQVFVSWLDIPAIIDMDGDGDLDIASFEAGGGQVVLYKNHSVEDNLGIDSLDYYPVDFCWGKFTESQTNEIISLGKNKFTCGGTDLSTHDGLRHTGSTLTVLDVNGDGLKDALIGDVSNNNISYLSNGGTTDLAFMTAINTKFPSDDVPISVKDFTATYFVDADGDSIKDLIATTNNYVNGQNIDHIWFYKNNGTNAIPDFQFKTKNFLIDEMANFYGGADPAFGDINGDGLLDLVVGSTQIVRGDSIETKSISLLLNTGTVEDPQFTLTDDDFWGFSKNGVNSERFAPDFGDLDNDGDQDLLVGDSSGKVFFFENTAGANKPMAFAAPVYPYANFFETQNAKPHITDLDDDGLSDIIMGKLNNSLIFYKNIGAIGSPKFNPNPAVFPNNKQTGNIYSVYDRKTQNGSPFLIKSAGKRLLLLGTDDAGIKTYDHIEDNIYKDFSLLYDYTGNILPGRKLTISLADIDGDEYYEMAVGNERGGIKFYNTIFKTDTTSNIKTEFNKENTIIFPNPATNSLFVSCSLENVVIELINIHGTIVQTMENNTYNNVSMIPSGIYCIKIQTGQQFIYKKIVIQH